MDALNRWLSNVPWISPEAAYDLNRPRLSGLSLGFKYGAEGAYVPFTELARGVIEGYNNSDAGGLGNAIFNAIRVGGRSFWHSLHATPRRAYNMVDLWIRERQAHSLPLNRPNPVMTLFNPGFALGAAARLSIPALGIAAYRNLRGGRYWRALAQAALAGYAWYKTEQMRGLILTPDHYIHSSNGTVDPNQRTLQG